MATKKKLEKDYAPFMRECISSGGSTCPCCGNTDTEPWGEEDGGHGYGCNHWGNKKPECPLLGESWIAHRNRKTGKIEIELPYFIYEGK